MNSYMISIVSACIIFPLVAAVFTLPFVVVQYRKYGGIPIIRVLIVYSFILYSMCAFFLTVLPLPTISAVEAMPPKPVGTVPFNDLAVALRNAGFVLHDPSTFLDISHWKRLASSFELFQIVANIIMQIPLGIYLRYYFKMDWKKTLLIGFCVSLFYELTQLTGLWFIYPKAYRYAEVDDLINNTLGAMIGYWITPLFELFLPKRDEIDEMSYTKGLYATLPRRFFGFFFDSVFFAFISGIILLQTEPGSSAYKYLFLWILAFVIVFGVLPILFKGSTAGQIMVRLRVKKADGITAASFFQQLFRNFMLYIFETFMAVISSVLIGFSVFLLGSEEFAIVPKTLMIIGATSIGLLFFWWTAHCIRKHHTLPHSWYSKTSIVPIPVSSEIKDRPKPE